MVKEAEKIVKRSPLLPIYGLIIGVGLGIVAWLLKEIILSPTTPVFLRPIRDAVAALGSRQGLGEFVVAFGIWVILIGIAYFIVALMTGKDPHMPDKLPPRRSEPKGRR